MRHALPVERSVLSGHTRTFGSFVESLGGAGYDAANEARRLTLLASLHPVGVPFGGFVMTGIPIGILTCTVLLVVHLMQREQRQAS